MLAPIVVLAIGLFPIAFQEKWRQLHDHRRNVHKLIVKIQISLMCLLTLVTCAIVWNDDQESLALRSDVIKLRKAENEHQRYANETAKVVAKRARYVVSHIDGFLMEFAGKWGSPDLHWLCSQDSFCS